MGLAIQKASKVKEKMKEIRDVNDMDINQSKSNENPNYVSQATSNPNPLEFVKNAWDSYEMYGHAYAFITMEIHGDA